jgi:hypothetical protein
MFTFGMRSREVQEIYVLLLTELKSLLLVFVFRV